MESFLYTGDAKGMFLSFDVNVQVEVDPKRRCVQEHNDFLLNSWGQTYFCWRMLKDIVSFFIHRGDEEGIFWILTLSFKLKSVQKDVACKNTTIFC